MKRRIGIYCRVSSKEQEDNTSLDRQEREGIAFAVKCGESYEVYREAKSGGSLKGRTEMERMVTDIEAGLLSKVWVLTNDRLGRDADDTAYLLRVMRNHGVPFYVGGKLINPRDYRDFFMFRVEQAVAEMDRAQRAEKTTNGMHEVMDRGELASRRLYGYRRIHDDAGARFQIDPDQAAIVKRVFATYDKGESVRSILATLNREKVESPTGKFWGRTTMRNILRNPHFAGLARNARKELIKSTVYPAIVDEKVWRRARGRHLVERARTYQTINAHLGSGILRCGVCDVPYHFSAETAARGGTWTYCHDFGRGTCHGSAKRLLLRWVDLVFKVVYLISIRDARAVSKLYTKESEKITRQREQIERDVQRIDGKLEELSKQKARLVSAIARATISEADAGEEIGRINAEAIELEKAKAESRRDLLLKEDKTDLLLREFGADNFNRFISDEITDKERREMLRRIVESAAVTMREITIKIVSGKEFKLTYEPRDEAAAVKYLARQAGINTAILETDALSNLLDAVKEQGANSAAVVYAAVVKKELADMKAAKGSDDDRRMRR